MTGSDSLFWDIGCPMTWRRCSYVGNVWLLRFLIVLEAPKGEDGGYVAASPVDINRYHVEPKFCMGRLLDTKLYQDFDFTFLASFMIILPGMLSAKYHPQFLLILLLDGGRHARSGHRTLAMWPEYCNSDRPGCLGERRNAIIT